MNKSAKIFTVSGIFFTLILGSLGHFFYEWSGNNYVVGLFFATNESVWEHIKLALFPIFISFLLYGLFARAHSNFFAAFFMAMLTVILFIPLAFYGYTAVAEKSIIFIEIANALHVSSDTLLLGVLKIQNEIIASDLSKEMSQLPEQEQNKILHVLEAMLR